MRYFTIDTPIVLVVGALTGIGRATAMLFAEQGSRVAISGRNREEGDALAEALCARGAQAEFFSADVRYESDVSDLIDKTIERFGSIDAAVNAAGTEGSPGPLVEKTAIDYSATFDTNVLGSFLCMKYELQAMLPRQSGCIVNISSTLGQRTAVGSGLYAASKHAVEGLTRSAALEAAASNVRVNAVAPGPVDTDMLARIAGPDTSKIAALIAGVPLKRLGTPAEIAHVIAFICSPQASFVTGQIIGVDGGKMA